VPIETQGIAQMFTVQMVNFNYSVPFATKAEAVAYMTQACFESTLVDARGWIVGDFDPISGVYQDTRFPVMVE
jgi:hypothetical protein